MVQGHGLLLSSLLCPVYSPSNELVSQISGYSAVSCTKYNGNMETSSSEDIYFTIIICGKDMFYYLNQHYVIKINFRIRNFHICICMYLKISII